MYKCKRKEIKISIILLKMNKNCKLYKAFAKIEIFIKKTNFVFQKLIKI